MKSDDKKKDGFSSKVECGKLGEFSHNDSSFSNDDSVLSEEGQISPYSFEPQYNEDELEGK